MKILYVERKLNCNGDLWERVHIDVRVAIEDDDGNKRLLTREEIREIRYRNSDVSLK